MQPLCAHRPVLHLPISRLSHLRVFNLALCVLTPSDHSQFYPLTLLNQLEPFPEPQEQPLSLCRARQNWLCPSQVLPWFMLPIQHSSITLGSRRDPASGLLPFLPGGDIRIVSEELLPLMVLKLLKKLTYIHPKLGDPPRLHNSAPKPTTWAHQHPTQPRDPSSEPGMQLLNGTDDLRAHCSSPSLVTCADLEQIPPECTTPHSPWGAARLTTNLPTSGHKTHLHLPFSQLHGAS